MDRFDIYKGIQVNSQDFLALEVGVHSVTVGKMYLEYKKHQINELSPIHVTIFISSNDVQYI